MSETTNPYLSNLQAFEEAEQSERGRRFVPPASSAFRTDEQRRAALTPPGFDAPGEQQADAPAKQKPVTAETFAEQLKALPENVLAEVASAVGDEQYRRVAADVTDDNPWAEEDEAA